MLSAPQRKCDTNQRDGSNRALSTLCNVSLRFALRHRGFPVHRSNTSRTEQGDFPRLAALLVLGPKGKLASLLPPLVSNVQEENKFWHDPAISPYGLFTTIRWIWGRDTGMYGDHRYRVITYQYCPELARYSKADTFVTKKKFGGADVYHRDEIVINAVMPQIKSRLLQRKQPCTARAETTSH